MLQLTHTREDLRLLEAAEIAERNPRYNQTLFVNFCGTPGCLLGGYAAAHPEDWELNFDFPRLRGTDSGGWYGDALLVYFGLTQDEFDNLFSMLGCGNARTDGKKAAAYVRRFVRERAEARLKV